MSSKSTFFFSALQGSTPFKGLVSDESHSGAQFTSSIETFRVSETITFEPAGEGEHLYVRLTKRGLTTNELSERVAAASGVARAGIGYAGMKDKHATTEQWLSVPIADDAWLAKLEEDEAVDVGAVSRHPVRLRVGRVLANEFSMDVSVPDGEAGASRFEAALDALRRSGMANYYGPQRYGRDNLGRTRWVFDEANAPRSRSKRKFSISVLQSAIFDHIAARRIERWGPAHMLLGDLAKKHDSGGVFEVEDSDEASERASRLELSPTAPMAGYKVRSTSADAAAFEREVLESLGVADLDWRAFGKIASGARRPIRVPVEQLRSQRVDDAWRVQFSLPAGSYATTLLAELRGFPAGIAGINESSIHP